MVRRTCATLSRVPHWGLSRDRPDTIPSCAPARRMLTGRIDERSSAGCRVPGSTSARPWAGLWGQTTPPAGRPTIGRRTRRAVVSSACRHRRSLQVGWLFAGRGCRVPTNSGSWTPLGREAAIDPGEACSRMPSLGLIGVTTGRGTALDSKGNQALASSHPIVRFGADWMPSRAEGGQREPRIS